MRPDSFFLRITLTLYTGTSGHRDHRPVFCQYALPLLVGFQVDHPRLQSVSPRHLGSLTTHAIELTTSIVSAKASTASINWRSDRYGAGPNRTTPPR